jgi:YidC/Oxa1 family membrane protein insertase
VKPFYDAIAWLVVHIHSALLEPILHNSGWAWALSIVLLTVLMRLLLFPLFVKQTRNMRAMQVLQPKMKELQAKYKNDKERLNQEMMALWKEHGANPLAGCLPLILQIPVFIALFRVLNSIKPESNCTSLAAAGCFKSHNGISATDVAHFAQAKIFGVPVSAAFNSSKHTLTLLHASATSTKILCVVLIVLMGASTFWTQRQLMARNKASGTGTDQMAQQQKVMLYILPLTFAIFGYRFPLGVLLYWLTTNLWSMGQQHFVIARMDAKASAAATPPPATGTTGPAPGARPVRPQPSPAEGPPPSAAPAPKPAANRRPGNNRNKRNKRGRR